MGASTSSGRHRHRPRAGARRRRWRGPLLILSLVAVLGLSGVVGVLYAYARKYEGNVARQDMFGDLGDREQHHRNVIDGPLDVLVVGSDSRKNQAADFQTDPGSALRGQRTDTIMLVHLDGTHQKASVISIPRDTFVEIPKGGAWEGGKGKINAAYSYGGAPLLVRTVQDFTGVTIDHVVIVDFAGFKQMTDALGGVDVVVDKTVTDPRSHRTFHAGTNHLNGAQALDYVRQRYGLPGSDFDREKRQQQFLHALLEKATQTGTLANPRKLTAFLDAASSAVTVDREMPLVDMAFQLRHLRPSDLTFLGTPIAADARDDVFGAVLLPDTDKDAALFSAVQNDTLAAYLAQHPDVVNDATRGR